MNDETFDKGDSIKLRDNCIKILNSYEKKLTKEIQEIQEKSSESERQKCEFIFAKHKIDTQYDSNNTLFSPYEKNMRQKEEEKLDKLLSHVEESRANYIKEILERKHYLKEIDFLKEYIEFTEVNSFNLLRIQELEKKEIAEKLQSTIICDLNTLMEKTKAYSNICKRYPNKGKQGLDEINSCLKRITANVESVNSELNPIIDSNLGLITIIKHYIENLEKTYPVSVQFDLDEEEQDINDVRNLIIFRVIRNTCNSIINCSRTEKCRISLKYIDSKLSLIIEKNGVGVNLSEDTGLSMIKEMVLLLSGEFTMSSAEEKGTKLIISIPLKKSGYK